MSRFLTTTVSAFALIITAATANAETMTNAAEYRTAMIAPGTLSLMESEIALKKATNPKVMEFAGFEDAEQMALGTILKDLGTPAPDMSDKDKATLQALNDAPKGSTFDKLYIQDQIDGHKILGKINSAYLTNADTAAADSKEMECHHLAIFIRQAIDQHIANTKEIAAMLNQ